MDKISAGFGQFSEYLRDIKFSHSVFALPFAASALFIESVPTPNLTSILLLLACMISARSFAMGVNRLFDADMDKENKRTETRSIPAGRLTKGYSALFISGFAGIFIYCSALLSSFAAWGAVPVLLFLACYSLMKRLHYSTHLYLGVCLGLAPTAVYGALTGEFSFSLILLGGAIAVWTAGFDILYSLQDMDHDAANDLKSVPSRFGWDLSVRISRVLFSVMVLLLIGVGVAAGFGWIYYAGLVSLSAVLAYEHVLLSQLKRRSDLLRENPTFGKIFFDLNAWVSVGFFIVVVTDRLALN